MTSLPSSTDSPTLFTASDLSIGYGGRAIVSGIDLTVRCGDYWLALGANGEGKSTFVQTLLGSLRPLGGRLDFRAGHQRHRAIGFVPQSSRLPQSLPTTLREVVHLGMVNLGLPGKVQRERVEQALAQVLLADRANASFHTLSGGQQQRAMIARALVRQPQLLLLDEPTTGLDIMAEGALLDCVAALNKESALTVILVTHDLSLVDRYASHVMLFRDGRLINGAPEEVAAEETLLNPQAYPHD